jgi:nitroimidazol reductase NimA-like FMN-containing flavoprotein (pyridoxamine 5'-phosphate oxidase superfamily)
MFLAKQHKTYTSTVKEIPPEALEILRTGSFAYLGTAEPDCDPHLTAMFFLWDDESRSIYLISTKTSRKVANIRRNTRVCVTVDRRDPKSPARNLGVMIQGRAQLVEMQIVDSLVMVNFLDKYMHFLGPGYPMGSRIAIQVRPKTISFWKGAKFFKWRNSKKSIRAGVVHRV